MNNKDIIKSIEKAEKNIVKVKNLYRYDCYKKIKLNSALIELAQLKQIIELKDNILA